MGRVISRDVAAPVAAWRRALELLRVRLDLRAIGSWAAGKTVKDRERQRRGRRFRLSLVIVRCASIKAVVYIYAADLV